MPYSKRERDSVDETPTTVHSFDEHLRDETRGPIPTVVPSQDPKPLDSTLCGQVSGSGKEDDPLNDVRYIFSDALDEDPTAQMTVELNGLLSEENAVLRAALQESEDESDRYKQKYRSTQALAIHALRKRDEWKEKYESILEERDRLKERCESLEANGSTERRDSTSLPPHSRKKAKRRSSSGLPLNVDM